MKTQITLQHVKDVILLLILAFAFVMAVTSCQKPTQSELRQTNTCEECYRRIHTAPYPYNYAIADVKDTFITCQPDTIVAESYLRYQDSTGGEFDKYVYINCHIQ